MVKLSDSVQIKLKKLIINREVEIEFSHTQSRIENVIK